MYKRFAVVILWLFLGMKVCLAQDNYRVIAVTNGGNITGTIKWSGVPPHTLSMPITKDPQICDPDSHKRADLDRLIIGPDGGVANTVVYLKDVSAGKAMDLPEPRRFLDQRHCRYEPHILLVPANSDLTMKSSDATLHTIHMDGAASYNLPFPFPNQTVARSMHTPGIVNLKCNGGHVWMNAEMFVVSHPYYVVTGMDGKFELKDAPPGEYELVAWHEGWHVAHDEAMFDVLTEQKVERPVFTEPRTWEKKISVSPNSTAQANFTIGEK